jgi:hypothetical protein
MTILTLVIVALVLAQVVALAAFCVVVFLSGDRND